VFLLGTELEHMTLTSGRLNYYQVQRPLKPSIRILLIVLWVEIHL